MTERSEGFDLGKSAHLKASILSEGVRISERCLAAYGPPFLEKRRAYGNSDPEAYRDVVIPQELILLPDEVVCAVHVRESSQWELDYIEQGFHLCWKNTLRYPVTFPKRPVFYDMPLGNGLRASQVGTLYGGRALGIFVYGACSFADMGKACGYCSIRPNRSRETDFVPVVTSEQVYELTKAALFDEGGPINQIMINGGNFKNRDRSFQYYVEICCAARRAIDDSGQTEIELHLIVYPPENKALLQQLATLDVCVAMNLETYDPVAFAAHCPGKEDAGGQAEIIGGLTEAVKYLGRGKVYSIFVGGLEACVTMGQGFDLLAKAGITPVINVFHADPETPLADVAPPATERIIEMGRILHRIYADHPWMKPFYWHCGRNAIDTEAFLGRF